MNNKVKNIIAFVMCVWFMFVAAACTDKPSTSDSLPSSVSSSDEEPGITDTYYEVEASIDGSPVETFYFELQKRGDNGSELEMWVESWIPAGNWDDFTEKRFPVSFGEKNLSLRFKETVLTCQIAEVRCKLKNGRTEFLFENIQKFENVENVYTTKLDLSNDLIERSKTIYIVIATERSDKPEGRYIIKLDT